MGAEHHACIYLYTVTYSSLCRVYYTDHMIETCPSVLHMLISMLTASPP